MRTRIVVDSITPVLFLIFLCLLNFPLFFIQVLQAEFEEAEERKNALSMQLVHMVQINQVEKRKALRRAVERGNDQYHDTIDLEV